MADKQNRPIIGVDFDDTLFKHSYPADDSEPNWAVINYLRQRKREGAYIILVTCRHKAEDIKFAVQASKNVGIEFDAVNQNLPFMVDVLGDCRKIYCNEYIDDKNVTIAQIENMKSPKTKSKPVYVVIGDDVRFTDLMRELKRLDNIEVCQTTVSDCVSTITDLVDGGYEVCGVSIDESEWTPYGMEVFGRFIFHKTCIEKIDIRSRK